ncbi:MAG: phenylalanine--tRNA ligase beta subunit-related protein, partial [Coprothermobacter proteolyticus]
MKFSFNQLKKFWQEKDQVTWQQVKSYLEKHLEVEVEEEVPIDIPDSWWLKEVAPANEKNSRAEVHLENGSVIPVYLPEEVSHSSSSSGTSICVLVDTKSGTLLSRGDLGPLQELLGFATVSSNGSEAGSPKEAGTSAGRDDLSDVVLLRNAPEGPLKEVLELPDMLIKLSVLPNRGDLSHLFGLAREIACGMGLTLVVPTFQHKLEKRNGLVSIQTDGCLVYVGMLLENLRVEESPWWLKLELMRFGQRCINNVVDLTNYFLFNYGQPMHAFDFDTLTDHRIVVRQAKPGEKLVLLNNEEVTLDEDCMVIADAVKPVGVAGVMGGRDASVSSQTKRVLLEVAAFAPSSVAMSSRKLGVRTDASMLYERGVAPFGQVEMALLFADFVEQMGCAQATALWFAGEERRYRLVDYNPQRIVKLSSVKDQDLVDMISTKQWEVITEEGNNDGKKKIRIPAYRW